MKIAIIGAGPLGIEAALHFDSLGAAVTLFEKEAHATNFEPLAKSFADMTISDDVNLVTSEVGRKISGLKAQGKMTYSQYKSEYLDKLIESKELSSISRKATVLRVHKRFLSKDEQVEGRSRLADLFRVVFSVNPKDNVLKQMEENPEAFEKLGKEVIDSLHQAVEAFEDFDIVIDATGVLENAYPMGASNSEALNELNLKINCPIYYGFKSLKEKESILSNSKSVALIGSGEVSAYWLMILKEWLKEDRSRSLKLVTTETELFKKLVGSKTNNELVRKMDALLKENHQDLLDLIEKFQKDINDWKMLEPHIRAKTPRPVEPKSQIEIHNGYIVSSLDRLVDREGMFITCETVDFKNPELSADKHLLTLGADAIIVGNGHYKDLELYKGLNVNLDEKNRYVESPVSKDAGFYVVGAKSYQGDRARIVDNLGDIKAIEEDLMRYFSRA